MTEASKQWEGQIVDGIFPLRQYLGGSDHSAVFLTEHGGDKPQKAAIKLFPIDPATADVQLLRWESTSKLSHPNLLRLINAGRCALDGNELLYLVMEYAEEDLADILPQRALTAEETRDMLCPVLDALEYLHGKGLMHGDLKPANILATGDRLKLSSDAISQIGEAQSALKKAGIYDPPEASSGILTPAADVWSLGTTLVEVLTQHLPDWQPGPNREPVVPANLPEPFLEIARQCLRPEPQRRISVAEIAARLNPGAAVAAAPIAAAVAAAGASVGSVAAAGQLSPAAPRPVAPVTVPARAAARMQTNPHRPPAYRGSSGRPWFLVPLIVVVLAFVAILTVPRLLTHRPETPSTPAVVADKPSGHPAVERPAKSANLSKSKTKAESEDKRAVPETAKSAAPAMPQAEQKSTARPAADSLKPTSEKEASPPAASEASAPAATATVKTVAGGIAPGKGEVLDQVLPDVSPKARATIQGKVRVSVKVHVDPAGGVSEAELDSAGPSAFFADLALQAAKKWAFTAPEVNGKSVTSEWRLRFEFTQRDTKVIPVQTAP